MSFKVGDICIINDSGVWKRYKGDIVTIMEIFYKINTAYIQFPEELNVYTIDIKELDYATKLAKALL